MGGESNMVWCGGPASWASLVHSPRGGGSAVGLVSRITQGMVGGKVLNMACCGGPVAGEVPGKMMGLRERGDGPLLELRLR